MATKLLDVSDNGQAVTVRQGDEILLRLDENPTTGYRWELAPIDSPAVGFVRTDLDTTEPEREPDRRLGRGGTRAFRFDARAAGRARIALKYWQPWSGEDSVEGRFTIDVDVAP